MKGNSNRKMTPAFLQLLLAKLENPELTTKEFVALSKIYAAAAGFKTKPPKTKQTEAEQPNPEPAVLLSETEQILQIESAQRKSNVETR